MAAWKPARPHFSPGIRTPLPRGTPSLDHFCKTPDPALCTRSISLSASSTPWSNHPSFQLLFTPGSVASGPSDRCLVLPHPCVVPCVCLRGCHGANCCVYSCLPNALRFAGICLSGSGCPSCLFFFLGEERRDLRYHLSGRTPGRNQE